jgi:phospholipid/cholesterol/gamma-HCH transport system substrate-binding protein
MERNNFIETIIGAFVLLVAAAFMWKAYANTDIGDDYSKSFYMLNAKFNKVDGLALGGDVKLAGIKVGKIVDMSVDPHSYQANVKFKINEEIRLPSDTTAEIIGGSLLGEKYISLDPGFEEDKLPDNGTIEYTQSSISFESLIGKFMFDSASKNAKEGDKTDQPAATTGASAPAATAAPQVKH